VSAYYRVVPDSVARTSVAAQIGALLGSLPGNTALVLAVAEGIAPLALDAASPPVTPSALALDWDVGPADARLANLARTQAALAEFRGLVARARVDQRFEAAGGPSPRELDDLRGAVDRAISAAAAVQNRLTNFRAALDERQRLITSAVEALVPAARHDVALVGTTIGSFEARAKSYISADAGLVYGFQIDAVAAYFGANFYVRPINKRVPLRCGCLDRRLAFTLGLTASSVGKSGQREDLFGSQSALVGVGLRVTDVLRVSTGALVFQRLDPNPLLDHKLLKASAYLSTSLDWDARSALGKLGEVLFK
jgi:hypothetical protein